MGGGADLLGDGNAKAEQYPHEVGRKNPNPFGLYDMHGNLMEWCQDTYQAKLPGGRDPVVASAGAERVLRGGSWDTDCVPHAFCLTARPRPASPYRTMGFRVARTE